MEILNNLPVILAASTAFLAGLYGYLNNLPNSRVYQNMSLFLIVFYIIGTLLKRTAKSIWEDVQEKAALSVEGDLMLDGQDLEAIEALGGAANGAAGGAGAGGGGAGGA
ncbi:MAG: hypothetical protein FWH01_06660, partial [Oscillospiraceae bacterium]|nr:hypothetical protein [Oscillospiraceae bacterium]